MRLTIALLCSICFSQYALAQDPIHWSWTVEKISDKEYVVKLTATIDAGWHLYSQQQPDDAIALPTEIRFNKNPLLELKDRIKEIGTLQKYRDPVLDIEAWQYAHEVAFVQRIKLKSKAKTAVRGTIEYQACTDEKCLPPKTVSFTISI